MKKKNSFINFTKFKALRQLGSNNSLIKGRADITDIKQGGLKTCFFYSALASLLNHQNGADYIKDAFPYYNEVKKINFFFIHS